MAQVAGIKVIVNKTGDEYKLHLRVDGRVFEQCNTDDIQGSDEYTLEDFFDLCKEQGEDLEYSMCARCFPDA